MSSFRNRDRAKQLVDFRGLKFGNTSPTDIDLSIDWKGKTFIFVELKGKLSSLTLGQKLHLEGIVKAIRAGGKVAYGIYAKHDTVACEDVPAEDSFDVKVFDGKQWTPREETLGEVMQQMYEEHNNAYSTKS